jgi:NitT/TauT family transport system substrate-binding protein
MHFRYLKNFLLAALLALSQAAHASGPTVIRVGVMEFGTVNWELDVIQANGLAKKRGIELKIVPLASAEAPTVALQGGAVDIIVTDWIWVTRQRAESKTYTFAPYSNAVGSLVADRSSGIRTVADLKDRKLGIAGGPTDKTWLLLRAYARQQLNVDLPKYTKPVFAAPPLLTELALRNQVDAALNYWHYAARLEANGMTTVIDMPDILKGLGIHKPIPMIGWVFQEDWAARNAEAVKGFLAASYEAKALLAASDAEWNRIKPKMRAENDAVFIALRNGFIKGIPTCSDQDTMSAVGKTYRILAEMGGTQLVGKSAELAPGTFWSGFRLPPCPAG